MTEEITKDQLDEYIKGLVKELKDNKKSADSLKGELDGQKSTYEKRKSKWESDKKELEEDLSKLRGTIRKDLETKIKGAKPKFTITKEMTDEYLKALYAGILLGDAENTREDNSPPKLGQNQSGEKTLSEKETMINKLLS